MNYKHIGIGTIFIIIGALILSPIDDILVLIPASIALDSPEILPLVWMIGAILLGIGIVLVGKSFLFHFGTIGRAIARHPVVLLGSIIFVSLVIYLIASGAITL